MKAFCLAILSVTLFAAAFVSTAQGAEMAWWHLNVTAAPTVLPRAGESQVVITPTNLGDGTVIATESNPVTVTDTLPEGMKPVTYAVREGGLERAESHKRCAIVGQTVTCTATGKIAPYAALMTLVIVVEMQEPMQDTVENQSIIEGGEQESGGKVRPAPNVQHLKLQASPGEKTPFGVEDFELTPENEAGEAESEAGSHPFQLTTTIDFNQRLEADEDNETPGAGRKPGEPGGWPSVAALPRDLHIKLPDGLIGDPDAVAKCTTSQFKVLSNVSTNRCPADSAVGVANVVLFDPWDFLLLHKTVPVFSVETIPGEPARFGFVAERVPVVLRTAIPSGGTYAVEVTVEDISQVVSILSSEVTLWGTPGDARHQSSRGWQCLDGAELRAEGLEANCEPNSEPSPTAFLTLPTACEQAPEVDMSGSSWAGGPDFPEQTISGLTPSTPFPQMTGCGSLEFDPSLTVAPEATAASTPTGLNVTVGMPQHGLTAPEGRAESALKQTTVVLPQGLLLNPASANALQDCSPNEFEFLDQFGHPFGEEGVPEEEQLSNETSPSGASACVNGSKVGTVTIQTPLLENELTGSVYLARQNTDPFHSPLAIYLLAEDPADGVRIKLAGSVEPNPVTGQLTSTFRNTPQLPFTALHLHFLGGERASLTTPPTCEPATTTSEFIPWASQVAPATPESTFRNASGVGGSPCPTPPLAFSPSFKAGPRSPKGGAFSPLIVDIGRPDGQQPLDNLTVTLPPGFSAVLASVTPCPEPPSGQEWACGEESHIGEAREYSGLGTEPVQLTGQVYLTSGYDGAPFGLLVRTLAKAGPFNLGYVNVRSRINVNPTTAQVTVTTDPGPRDEAIPTMLDGVPVQLKALEVAVNRPAFDFNPTSCDAFEVTAALEGSERATSSLGYPFKAEDCASLPFHPSFSASVIGEGSITNGTRLNVKVTSGGLGVANIAKVDLELPESLPSRLETLQKACLPAIFAANPAECPKDSLVGHATVRTPILKNPLSGPAYLVARGAKFPDLEFVLQGEGITLVLDGKTDIKEGITYSKFESTPDAPFTTFETELPAGRYSLLGTTPHDVCGKNLFIPTKITGQNGAVVEQDTHVNIENCKPTITVLHTRPRSHDLELKLKLSTAGTLRITGRGLKSTTVRNARAGTKTLRIPYTRRGRTAAHKHRKLKLHATLTADGRTGTTIFTIRA
ncbi:MAG TPA: hypothetical protein VMA83_00160 [Solirubrobacteraceae bacterium]|nr:hypothetical protein [Solirubrobacteraceae bacterium]